MDVYWLEQSEADVPADNDWLAESERARLDAMRFPKRRATWRLGRWTAKRAVVACLNEPGDRDALSEIEVRPATSGAPAVYRAGWPAPFTLSLSHRAGVGVCAVAPGSVALGCDLEMVEPRSGGFLADYFTLEEQDLVARVPDSERPRLMTLLWSAKESALKALGEGLRVDTRRVVVGALESLECIGQEQQSTQDPARAIPSSHGAAQWHRLRVLYSEQQVFDGWWQNTGQFVRTMVAAPSPAAPIILQLPTDLPNPLLKPGAGGFPR